MRLLHTADWHLGKSLEGRSRLAEQEQFLDELHDIVQREKIDAILMAGDVFDTVNPPAAAEELFYDSVSRFADKGTRPVIIIAGNHDHPDRLAAAAPLAKEQGITIIGRPIASGLVIDVPSSAEQLQIAALPYPSESRLNVLLEASLSERSLRDEYALYVADLFEHLSTSFAKQTVNIAMSHIFVTGGQSTDSERPIQVGGAYTVGKDNLPAAAQYVALGHLHRPQTLHSSHAPIRYAGSPLAYSFSEAGYAKSVTIIDAEPGRPVHIEEVLLSCGKPLVKWKAVDGLAQVYDWLEQGRDANAWLDLEIHLKEALTLEEIHRLRKEHTGLIHIRPVFEQIDHQHDRGQQRLPIDQLFRRFYERQTGGAQPSDELIDLFLNLLNAEDGEETEAVHDEAASVSDLKSPKEE